MVKRLTLILSVALLFLVTSCNIKTPEIRGLVLDAETKQPVENAWVTATLEVYSKTVAGDVHQSLFVGKTWSEKNGRFVIPSKKFEKPSFPASFKNKIESLNIAARAITSKGYISEGIGLVEIDEKKQILIYLKPPKDAQYYRSAITGLYDYILDGRLGVSVPIVPEEERVDVYDLAIEAYERYLEKYGQTDSYYNDALRELGYLYKKRGDYERALKVFKRVKEFDEKRGITLWLKEYDVQINEIRQKLLEKPK